MRREDMLQHMEVNRAMRMEITDKAPGTKRRRAQQNGRKRLSRVALLLSLSACTVLTGKDALLDPDGDGSLYGEDCDDNDPETHPGAVEVCDGLDNDCDGEIDEADAEDAQAWYSDADGDGYGDADGDALTGCAGPTGTVADHTDCDDQDSDRFPGAAERCGDGVVNDCDSDAETAAATCVIIGDRSLSAATARLIGEAEGDYAGWAVAGAGDVNGDGVDDLLIGAEMGNEQQILGGAAYVVSGPVSGDRGLSLATASLYGPDPFTQCGTAVAGAGDTDGDGYDDLLVGGVGVGWLAFGPITGTGSLGDIALRLSEETREDYAGTALDGGGDVDGDGQPDLIIGALFQDAGGDDAGAAYLLLGPLSADRSLSAADARLIGETSGDLAGQSVALAGDVNGDGLDDLLIGAPAHDIGGDDAGIAYLLFGATALNGDVDLSDWDERMIGEDIGDGAGIAVSGAGDVDADGYADLLVGAFSQDEGGNYAGAAYLVLGPATHAAELAWAQAKLTGEAPFDQAGWSLAGAGDVNADGYADLLIGAFGQDDAADEAGAAYLQFGPVTGDMSLSKANVRLLGEARDDNAGTSVAGAGDTDGDGRADLLIGAPLQNAGGADAGAAYLQRATDL